MRQLIILIFTAFIYHHVYSQSSSPQNLDRTALEMQYIQTAKDYNQLQKLLAIMPEKSPHWNYIPSIFPIKATNARITSAFGYRFHPIDGVIKYHSAIDIPCQAREYVYATASGVIKRTAYEAGGLGNYIMIDHINGFSTVYGHLAIIYVRPDDYVKKGQVIGLAGSTGKSTGVHVHYGVRKESININPFPFCFVSRKQYSQQRKQPITLNSQNYRNCKKFLFRVNEGGSKVKVDSTSHNHFLEESFFK